MSRMPTVLEAQDPLTRMISLTRSNTFKLALVWAAVLAAITLVFRELKFDLGFIASWAPFVARGIPITIGVSLASIALSLVFGLLGALGRMSKNPVFYGVATFYTSFIRGTPLLVQIFIIYLGLPQIGQHLVEAGRPELGRLFILDPIPAGIAALSINYGAYMTEIIRGGILSVGRGQMDASASLGMTYGEMMRRIVLPQALRVIIPPTGNEFIAMTKDSALVSVMGIWELTFRATKIGRQYFRNLELLVLAAAIYWIMTIIFSALQTRMEAKLARAYER